MSIQFIRDQSKKQLISILYYALITGIVDGMNDLTGLQKSAGETFRWKGKYEYDLNEAHTLETHLNVFESFKPELPEEYRDAEFVFLANIDPELQLEVLQQVKNPKLVACDTMNFWIGGKKQELIKTLGKVDMLVINEAEVRQLADEPADVA